MMYNVEVIEYLLSAAKRGAEVAGKDSKEGAPSSRRKALEKRMSTLVGEPSVHVSLVVKAIIGRGE